MLLVISSTYNISCDHSFDLFFGGYFRILDLTKTRSIFLHEMVYVLLASLNLLRTLKIFSDQNIFKRCPVKFFAKIVARGNAVQIFPNFPAKRLSIYRKKHFVTPFY